jgi:hypothetical protein
MTTGLHGNLPFSVSHPIELTELRRALTFALVAGMEDHNGIVKHLRERVVAAGILADEKDRAHQLAGGRAAND